MPESKKIPFTCAALAMRSAVSGTPYAGSFETQLSTGLVLAESGADAEACMVRRMLESYPKGEGWTGHHAAAEPITEEHIKRLIDGE